MASRLMGGVRLLGLLLTLVLAWLHGMVVRPQTTRQRAAWRQRWCRAVLRALRISTDHFDPLPASGLLVCNHLSYLDVLVLGALLPATFVSKAEVRGWPLVGGLCARAGTIFLRRERPRDAVLANAAIADVLRQGMPVVVFPEGTTTSGHSVLPFRSALLQPAIEAGASIWPMAMSYWFADGRGASGEAAYAGAATLLPHLLRVARLPPMRALVQADMQPLKTCSRSAAAQQAGAAVQALLDTAGQGLLRRKAAADAGVEGDCPPAQVLQHQLH